MGMDDAEVGEFAYDYVEVSRDVVHGIEEEPEQINSERGSSAMGLREKSGYDGSGDGRS